MAAILLCGVTVLAVTGLTFLLPPSAIAPADTKKRLTSLTVPDHYFQNWPKPDLAVLLSAEQHGYLGPCGCSRPQVGGLERRYNLLQILKSEGWPVVAVDLGDIPQRQGPRKLPNIQGLIKYRIAMESLRDMNYLATGLGEYDGSLRLFDLLGEYALNNPSPRVLAANLHEDIREPFGVKSFEVKDVAGSPMKVGVASFIGPSVQANIKDPSVKFGDNRKVIPQVLADMERQKPQLRMLLYQGSVKETKALLGDFQQFNIALCLSPEDEPSAEPTRVGNTLLVTVGHKGRYVGVVGVYRTGKADQPYDLRYQLVSLGEEFLTPAAEQAGHPIVKRMERYTQELKARNYLARYPQVKHPMQLAVPGTIPTFVGSHKCKSCHKSAYKVWENSKHAHAYEALVNAKHPSLRQYDAECIVCHTVGFGYASGYKNETDTPLLKGVGCESCHGPGSEHIKDQYNERWHKLMNPWKAKPNETAKEKESRVLRIDRFCQECHDIDNDVKYKFEKRWPPIAHKND